MVGFKSRIKTLILFTLFFNLPGTFIMCNRQFTKMLPLKPEIYEALLKQDELDRRHLRPKDYYSEEIFNSRR